MAKPNEKRLRWLQNTLQGVGSALAYRVTKHKGKTILLDTLTGSTFTLPASTGKGQKIRFQVSLVPTSNSHIIKVANASDIIQGTIHTVSDNSAAVLGYIAGASDDTITLNRTTTGGVTIGEYIELEDIKKNVWAVRGFTASTGTEATPFSSTV